MESLDPVLWDSTWEDFFCTEKPVLNDIMRKLNGMEGQVVDKTPLPPFFPMWQNVFRFTAIDPGKVKGVVIGMEPYASYTVDNGIVVPDATGRSFEVSSVSSWQQKIRQSSLRNILKAVFCEMEWDSTASLDHIRKEISSGYVKIPSPHEWFNIMEGRGVMFLNTALTVKPLYTGSHLKLWDEFSKDLIRYIAKSSPNACWMLFGKDAQKAAMPILEDLSCSNIVTTCHPRLPGFVAERPFRGITKLLNYG